MTFHACRNSWNLVAPSQLISLAAPYQVNKFLYADKCVVGSTSCGKVIHTNPTTKAVNYNNLHWHVDQSSHTYVLERPFLRGSEDYWFSWPTRSMLKTVCTRLSLVLNLCVHARPIHHVIGSEFHTTDTLVSCMKVFQDLLPKSFGYYDAMDHHDDSICYIQTVANF